MRLDARDYEAESIASLLEQYGAVSVTFQNATIDDSIERHLNTLSDWESLQLSALLPLETDLMTLVSKLNSLHPPGDRPIRLDRLEDQDWENSWRQNFAPIDVGNDIWVCPSWCDPPQDAKTVIRLDPGLAFGTGSHATTRLCLQQMGQLFTGTESFRNVLDYGCGSGILAIVAAKLGAHRVWAVDVDPRALTTTTNNAITNNVVEQLCVRQPEELPRTYMADMLIANILADTLIELAVEIQSRLKPGGRLLLSGILRHQIDDVSQHYAGHFVFDCEFMDEWCLLTGVKHI